MLYWMCIHNGFRSHMAKIANYGQRTNVKHTLHLSNTPKLNFSAFKQLNKKSPPSTVLQPYQQCGCCFRRGGCCGGLV